MKIEHEELPDPLRRAVDSFRGQGPVGVTSEKLRVFLEDTQAMDLSAARRLRLLAIELESSEFTKGWAGLRAIYEAAMESDPNDGLVLHSWGVSASAWMEDWMTPDFTDRVVIADEAERILNRALELFPNDSSTAHALGLIFYGHPARADDADGHRSRALGWFSRAVEWDGGNTIAQLYMAHCLHDARDWSGAIAEYEKIDLERLACDWPAWRAIKCREQLASCYAGAGQADEAIDRFTAFLDDCEAWDEQQLEERVVNVDELVSAVMEDLDSPELLARTRALVDRLRLRRRYLRLW